MNHKILASLTVCALTGFATHTPAADNPLLGTTWKIAKVQGVAVPPNGTLTFEAEKVSGTSGCNNYWASVDYTQTTAIDIGPPQSARVYCPGVMSIERAMFASLETITSYEISGTTLKLALDDGDVFLEFVK